MCLVSYSPTSNGFLICSNRDESPLRSNAPLEFLNLNSIRILCPVDTKGGSWIICGENGTALCLLNGAFVNHSRQSNYRMSRGIMMKSFFEYVSTKQFLYQFEFARMEPFTMVIKDLKGLYEFRWDGSFKHIKHLEADKLHVWSSATLYSAEMQDQRELAFRKEYRAIEPTAEALLKIHRDTEIGDTANNFVMHREERVATISITVLEQRNAAFHLSHHNLRNGVNEEENLELKQELIF